MDDLTKIDLYELLNILPSATTQDVKKAYRKKALKCHPDKNPDNPKAAELFHQLSRALEVLIDESARAAYDKVINAKKAAALRNKELDSKRKKLKEDLEARERQSMFETAREKSAADKLKAEIERLRKEGSKQLEEEIEIVRKQVQEEKFSHCAHDSSLYRLKVNWTNTNGQDDYSQQSLQKIFSKYGDIEALVVSSKKKGSALLEYSSPAHAYGDIEALVVSSKKKGSALLEFSSPAHAIKAQKLEKGYMSNPLTVSWLSGTPPSLAQVPREYVPIPEPTQPSPRGNIFPSMPDSVPAPKTKSAFPCFSHQSDVFTKNRQDKQEEDFETLVLARMKQAQEEKRRAQENGES